MQVIFITRFSAISLAANLLIQHKEILRMKKIAWILSFTFLLSSCDVLQNLPTSTGSVTEAEAGQGIKEALSQGIANAVLQLNKEDGFFKDAFYKILLPPEAKKVENTLRDKCYQCII